ncbi:MAG: hypothetical protein ACX94C_11645 [Phycisphaerales bacterium]
MAVAKKSRRRRAPGNRAARIAQEQRWASEAYERAQNGGSEFNDSLVVAGFKARGLRESEIKPRENVLSFHAWKHLGRSVMKGERGVKVPVIRGIEVENAHGETENKTVRGSAAVFHISQTKIIGDPDPDQGSGLGSVELAQNVMDSMISREKQRRKAERELTTKAGVARAVVAVADDSGMRPGSGELDDMEIAQDREACFAFRGTSLPGEILEALQGQPPCVRALFQVGRSWGGGEDTLGEFGADWMIARAREQTLRSADSVAGSIRGGSNDPRGELLAVLHDLRGHAPAGHFPAIELVNTSELIEGSYFEIAGDGFAVYTRDGAMRAGNGTRSFNLDSVPGVPIDAGTLDRDARTAPESLAAPIPF